jgi:hypothetical protein
MGNYKNMINDLDFKVNVENNSYVGRHQWLVPVILATQEAEIRKTAVLSQPRQIVGESPSQKYTTRKKDWWNGSHGTAPV